MIVRQVARERESTRRSFPTSRNRRPALDYRRDLYREQVATAIERYQADSRNHRRLHRGDPDLNLPGRWVDWEIRVPAPAWISIAWREQDDRLRTGARATLAQLLKDAHTQPYDGEEADWPSWRTFAAALADPQLSMAGLSPNLWGIGHSTPTTAAVVQQDGTIIADAPRRPVPGRPRLAQRPGGRQPPGPETYTPTLVSRDEPGLNGWNLRLAR
ncbi:hypothetical protein [Streptomyces sp. NPDC059122]|uniref:hypothetical protein n=1 Tax=Streptomyces sp. NPDC059122 TaxID=3346732 RepID=UPI0036B9D725